MSTRTETISFQLDSWPVTTSQSRVQVTQPEPRPSTTSTNNEDAVEVNYQQLHPIDKGFAAWRLLCTAFVFEALLWGISPSRSLEIERQQLRKI